MNCPKCGAEMDGPVRDYEYNIISKEKISYDMYSCPKCMELIFKNIIRLIKEKPWSVS